MLMDYHFATAIDTPDFILLDFFSTKLQSKSCLTSTSVGLRIVVSKSSPVLCFMHVSLETEVYTQCLPCSNV